MNRPPDALLITSPTGFVTIAQHCTWSPEFSSATSMRGYGQSGSSFPSSFRNAVSHVSPPALMYPNTTGIARSEICAPVSTPAALCRARICGSTDHCPSPAPGSNAAQELFVATLYPA